MPALQKLVPFEEVLFFPQQAVNLAPSAVESHDNRANVKASTSLFRVLVVEDDPTLLALYGHMLDDAKVSFDLCSNGHEALERLSTTFYDLVITDLNLPGLDGISLLQWIQQHRPATTAVVVSGDGGADRILAAMRRGAKDYLVKPFPLPEFFEMIDRWRQPQRHFNREVFSSMMKQVMHDVRSEVLNLEIMIKMLRRDKFGGMDAGVKGELLTMQAKLEQLKELTTDYSLLAKNLLQSDGHIQTERIGLKEEAIIPVLDEMQDALQRKEIKVSCSQDLTTEGDIFVMGNRVMLKCVFRTLFSNAIKHCRAAGTLSYGLSSNDRRYKIYVANEGEVVPMHLQASIFDEFVQGRPGESSLNQADGLGLGLALAKDILRQHGGDIWYEPMSNGSKFVCTLPPHSAQLAA